VLMRDGIQEGMHLCLIFPSSLHQAPPHPCPLIPSSHPVPHTSVTSCSAFCSQTLAKPSSNDTNACFTLWEARRAFCTVVPQFFMLVNARVEGRGREEKL
jgi:hypothetical protein